MKTENFDDQPMDQCADYTFYSKNKGEQRFEHSGRKHIIMSNQLANSMSLNNYGRQAFAVDSHIHKFTKFTGLKVDDKFLIDIDLKVYIIRHRQRIWREYGSVHKEWLPVIEKFICPHHRVKSPQVRFADGVLYCGRCNRVLNEDFENISSFGELESGTECQNIKNPPI